MGVCKRCKRKIIMKKIYLIGVALLLAFSMQTITHADNLPAGCVAGDNFSATTGQSCTVPEPCHAGDLYNSQTGAPCGTVNYLPGCFAGAIYSSITGNTCDDSTITNNTNTQPMENNNVTTTSPGITPAITVPDITQQQATSTLNADPATPAPLTQDQANANTGNAAMALAKTKYPDAVWFTGMMSNGENGITIQVSSTDSTPIAEMWIANGVASIHWIDTTLGNN